MPTLGSPAASVEIILRNWGVLEPSVRKPRLPASTSTICRPALPSQSGSSSVILQSVMPKPRPE